jgi:hypothetical protein
MSETPQNRDVARTQTPIVCVVAIAVTVCTILFHLHTYWWSESATACDITVATDEGLVSLQVPLCRLAAKEMPTLNCLIYERGPTTWTCGRAGKCPLRTWMSQLKKVGCDGAMFADFGYWKGSWQSNSRPGPFLRVFVPVWFVGVVVFGGFLAFYFRIIRFRLRSILIAMTLTAGLMFLVTLRTSG